MKNPSDPSLPDKLELDRSVLLDGFTILRTEVGSTAHGVTHSSNDMDEIAVYIPPISEVVGLTRPEHYIHRPGRGPADPSGPGDLDRTYYTLTKFVRLLNNGNPSILFALFGPVHHSAPRFGPSLIEIRRMFVNDRTRRAYLGYMEAQRRRITGERGAAGRVRRSPEGGGEIDWKYAMHMVRLGVQGLEYLTTGDISIPSLRRDMLLSIRSGEMPLDEVIDIARAYEASLKDLTLSDANVFDWTAWLARMHAEHWALPCTSESEARDE